jgi:predicted dehydrogenase
MDTSSRPAYRLGVVGFAHMHVNELVAQFVALEQVQLVACADTVPTVPSLTDVDGSRRANLKRALGHRPEPRLYSDYRKMLDNEDLDIAIFCPEISRHAEVAEELAARRVHMVTEKPMAGASRDALRMARAARDAGVVLMVNWPTTWSPRIRDVKDLVDAGTIGDVWEIKWRNATSLGPLAVGSQHPGDTVVSGVLTHDELAAEWWYQAEAGGGALLDYCSYGACLAAWYLDRTAVDVRALTLNLRSPFGDVEDNAVMVVRFPDAIAVIESSWTTSHPGVPTGPIVYGSKGTIVVDGERALVFRDGAGVEPAPSDAADALPVGRATIAEEFVRTIETGQAPHPTLDVPINLASTAMLDAAVRSAASGQVELVDGMPGDSS